MGEVLTCKATLRARCGCWKHMDIPFPPNRELLVPLKPRPVSLNQDDLAQPRMEIRRFELTDYKGGKDAWADYEERP